MTRQDPTVERHPRLFFPDGDIVLSAPSPSPDNGHAQSYQLFCVHSVLLRYHSAVFANMFAVATSGDVLDGLPIVEMHDEAPDLARLLTFLYSPSELHVQRLSPNTPLEVTGIVRLANKYMLDSLRDRLVQHVAEDWPRSLFDWDRQEAEIASMKGSIANTSRHHRLPGYETFPDCVPEPVAAILFAQEFGCPGILPAAFYQLARTSVKQDWDTAKHMGLERLARWSLLDKEDLLRYLRGCQALDDYCDVMVYNERVGAVLSHGCRPWWSWDGVDPEEAEEDDRSYPCFEYVQRLFQTVWKRRGPRDPLRSLYDIMRHRETLSLAKTRHDLCYECEPSLVDWAQEERKKVWRRLPEFFGLH